MPPPPSPPTNTNCTHHTHHAPIALKLRTKLIKATLLHLKQTFSMSYADLGPSTTRTRIEKWRHRVADTVALMQDAAPWVEHEGPYGFPVLDLEIDLEVREARNVPAPYESAPSVAPQLLRQGEARDAKVVAAVAAEESVTRSGRRYDQNLHRAQVSQRQQAQVHQRDRKMQHDERPRKEQQKIVEISSQASVCKPEARRVVQRYYADQALQDELRRATREALLLADFERKPRTTTTTLA